MIQLKLALSDGSSSGYFKLFMWTRTLEQSFDSSTNATLSVGFMGKGKSGEITRRIGQIEGVERVAHFTASLIGRYDGYELVFPSVGFAVKSKYGCLAKD